MPFQIVRNDIVKVKADAIVNTANPKPQIGSGTDTAVYQAAGKELLLRERKKIGDIAPGQVAVTPAFALPAKVIIHTVGPVWIDGNHHEIETLASCYRESLEKAKENACKSIAFPLIATGSYGFPKDRALQTAISVISDWLLTHEMKVTLVVFDQKSFALSGKVFHDVDTFIDEHYVTEKRNEEYAYGHHLRSEIEMVRRRRKQLVKEASPSVAADYDESHAEVPHPLASASASVGAVPPAQATSSLENMLAGAGETFQERLLRLIDARQLSDVDVYNKANLDRKLFSKIRCNAEYHPKNKTAVALAIALELSIEETRDLLERAEFALSPSSQFDLIITWFIQNRKYDIYEINLALFDHKQPLLGA